MAPDWTLLHAFIAVAETGSLSAAARKLGASQPTVGRQIKTLEDQLETQILRRHPRGFELTEAGAQIFTHAKEMENAAHRVALVAGGKQTALDGTVRITTSEIVGIYHMPKIIADIRKQEPGIEIELVPSDQSGNLSFREADIAIRMYRPTQQNLIALHIGDIHFSVFASKEYIARRGKPQTFSELTGHDLVGYDENTAIIKGFSDGGVKAERSWFGVRTDNSAAYWELVRAGCGIGFGQASIGNPDPLIEEIKLDLPLLSLPIWIAAHEAMRQTPRVRRIWDLLKVGLSPLVS